VASPAQCLCKSGGTSQGGACAALPAVESQGQRGAGVLFNAPSHYVTTTVAYRLAILATFSSLCSPCTKAIEELCALLCLWYICVILPSG